MPSIWSWMGTVCWAATGRAAASRISVRRMRERNFMGWISWGSLLCPCFQGVLADTAQTGSKTPHPGPRACYTLDTGESVQSADLTRFLRVSEGLAGRGMERAQTDGYDTCSGTE